ncbi:MAG: hypothetical protein FIB06_14285, partial [Betaproteobacteria bacterium]|nr:hypothetical protein [Betaproteobacteria bacterium]
MRSLVIGAAGSGTSTLGQALASEFGASFFEADDHFWVASDPPYQTKRSPDERLRSVLDALSRSPSAVLAGSVVGWGSELENCFSHVVFLSVPTDVRLARLRQREMNRFGHVNEAFLDWAAKYDEGDIADRSRAAHERWLSERTCLTLRISGDVPVEQGVTRIVEALSNNAFERPCSVGGPRLAAAEASCPAAQLDR